MKEGKWFRVDKEVTPFYVFYHLKSQLLPLFLLKIVYVHGRKQSEFFKQKIGYNSSNLYVPEEKHTVE